MRILLITAVLASGCGGERAESKPEPTPVAKPDPLEQRCVEWGVAYYKQIGSYPTLTSGAVADDEARARCKRSIDAYPNPEIAKAEQAIVEMDRQRGDLAGEALGAKSRIEAAPRSADPVGAKAEAEAAYAKATAHFDALTKERSDLMLRLAQMRREAK